MTTVDWIALAVIAVTALNGLRRGLVVGAFGLVGIVAGAYAGAKLAPELLSGESAYTPLVALAGAVVLGSLLRLAASVAGGAVRSALLALPPLRALDTLGGAPARRRDRAGARLGGGSRGAPRSRPERPPPGGAALADPARDQPAGAARAAPRRDRARRPPRPDRGAAGPGGAAGPCAAARPRRSPGAGERAAGDRDVVRAGSPGLGVGRGPRPARDERARRGRDARRARGRR